MAKFNKKTIIGALAGLGLTAWAVTSMFKKDKAEGETSEATEASEEIEVDSVDDVEVEA